MVFELLEWCVMVIGSGGMVMLGLSLVMVGLF